MKHVTVIHYKALWTLAITTIHAKTEPLLIVRSHPTGKWALCELRSDFRYPPDHPNANFSEEGNWIIAALGSTSKRKVFQKWKRQLARGRRWF